MPIICSDWTTLRLFPKWIGGPVPVFCEQETEECIKRVFSYAFREGTEHWPEGFVPKIHFVRIQPEVPFEVLGQQVMPIRLDQTGKWGRTGKEGCI